jgi:FemAB-related protein (PEP-CTERM system-associated)
MELKDNEVKAVFGLEIKELTPKIAPKWDEYVLRSDKATFFHQLGWKRVLEKVFGYKPLYLAALRNGQVRGIFPLFQVWSLLLGKAFISLPRSAYGGICADTPEIEKSLYDKAVAFASAAGVNCIEMRNLYPSGLNLSSCSPCVTFIKELPKKKEACYSTLPKKAREAINQAIKKHALEAEVGSYIDEFYEQQAINLKRLGIPSFPYSLYKAIISEFPESKDILVVKYKGKPVSTVMSFFFKDTIMPYYAGEIREYVQYRINNFKYLKLMEYAVEKGYRRFDFGTTQRENKGGYNFKRHQGFGPIPLTYQYYLKEGKKIPETSSNSDSFALYKRLWRKLPLGITKIVGPRIVRYLP